MFSDNGGEFKNSETRDICENMNIEVITTAAYAPFSNGLLEKHNHVLTNILFKLKHEKKFNWETSLKWASNAKSSLINVHGFSAYQLVFGRNPNSPANYISLLPLRELLLHVAKLSVRVSVLCMLQGKLSWMVSVLKRSGEP